VEYRFNAHGYRSSEFSERGRINILVAGCSYVFGQALPLQELFHALVGADLQASLGAPVVVWNLGVGGCSNDHICRLLQLSVPLLDPDLVLVNFTWPSRREYVAANGEFFDRLPHFKPSWSRVLASCWESFEALASDKDDTLNLFRNYKAIESLLSDRDWLFSAPNNHSLDRLGRHHAKARFVGGLHPLDGIKDFARDNFHPGAAHHRELADSYLDRIETMGIRARLQALANQNAKVSGL
jgi:hypothetical protein